MRSRPWCFSIFWLCCMTLVADGIQLIRENGFKPNTYYYHLGDGGHAYHVSDTTDSSVYFKCVLYERGCRGRAILRRVGPRFRHSAAHNHPPDPDFVGERHFRENLLGRIRTARFTEFNEILDDFRASKRYTRKVRASMNKRRLDSAMARVRGKRYPNVPDTLRDLTRELLRNADVAKTIDGEENLYAGSIDATDCSHHIAFFSPRMINFMGNLKLLQGDGTFKARPAMPFTRQCFVLVTTWNNSVVPLGWFLMESKSLPAYRAVFALLKDICPNLDPEVIISDWEYPQQKAWSEAFPNAEIQGCLWHLGRSFVTKAKALLLFRWKKVYPIVDFLKRAAAIALLPVELFEEALAILREDARNEDICLWYLMDPFFDYVADRWIRNDARQNWMSFFRCEHRTNNSCETHNRMLRKRVGAYRPNVFFFIEALAFLENNAQLDCFHQHQGGHPRRARRSQSVINDSRLKKLTKDLVMDVFQDRRETISNFLSRASTVLHGKFIDIVQDVEGDE